MWTLQQGKWATWWNPTWCSAWATMALYPWRLRALSKLRRSSLSWTKNLRRILQMAGKPRWVTWSVLIQQGPALCILYLHVLLRVGKKKITSLSDCHHLWEWQIGATSEVGWEGNDTGTRDPRWKTNSCKPLSIQPSSLHLQIASNSSFYQQKCIADDVVAVRTYERV